MEMKTALDMIKDSQKIETGFMVSFEKRKGGILASDHFPDKHVGEELIETEELAWKLAEDFSMVSKDEYVNIYVIDSSFSPVGKYGEREFNKY